MGYNRTWHEHHRIPQGASLARRAKWHLLHEQKCGCRPIPKTIQEYLRKGHSKNKQQIPVVSAAVEKSSPQRRFQRVIVALSKNQGVSISGGKGFGSSALKVNGKIFAMLSSRGDFVVKLSRTRVEELVASGKGEYFDPGHSRLMKQWIVVSAEKESWIVFAKQACGFVKKANAAG